MSSEITAAIKRMGFIPEEVVRDAKEDIVVNVTPADIRIAKIGNKQNCVMARLACRCLPNAAQAWFYRTAAWIHRVSKDGSKDYFVRYKPAPETQAAIEHFDETGEWKPGRYRLLAPVGSNRFSEVRKRSQKRKGRHQPGPAKVKKRRNVKVSTRLSWGTVGGS